MISGNSNVETLIPGSPVAIAQAMEHAGIGAEPSRQISSAWQTMSLPTWNGVAAEQWRTFIPREVQHFAQAPTAFSRVAAAMMRWEAAFRAARAEAEAAINDAAAAERATAEAQSAHREAVRKAALADPGTAEADVAPFGDPGALGLTDAQARIDAARARLSAIGDEVAAEIRAAARLAGGIHSSLQPDGGAFRGEDPVPPGLDPWGMQGWDLIALPFLKGLGGAAWETVSGAWELLPFQKMIEEGQGGPEWGDAYFEHWKTIGEGYAHLRVNPGDALLEMSKEMIAYDYWEASPPEALGRVVFNFAGLVGIGRVLFRGFNVLGHKIENPVIWIKVTDPPPERILIDRTQPGSELIPEDFDPWGGLSYDEFIAKHWDPDVLQSNGSVGGWRYPDNNGFDTSPGVPPPVTMKNVELGTMFDRFGDPVGSYVSPQNTPFPERSLPPDAAIREYHIYEVVKPFDEVSGYPQGGTITQAFEQPGGGMQIKLPKNINWLIDHGYIKEVVR